MDEIDDKVKIIRWPDGTVVAYDDFKEEEWLWKSDDYETVEVSFKEYEESL